MTLLGYKLVEQGQKFGMTTLATHDLVINSDGNVLKDRQGYLTKKAPVEKVEPKFEVGDKVFLLGESGEAVYEGAYYKMGYAMTNRGPRRLDSLTLIGGSKFEEGDKVRTVVGEVVKSYDSQTFVKFLDGTHCIRNDALELVERPKKEPKIGSVWRHKNTNATWVYLGDKYYASTTKADRRIVEDRYDEDLAYYLREA